MNFISTMAQLQLELFLLMLIGFICSKLGLITNAAQKSLSDILINVILPSNILCSFTSGVEVSSQFIQNCILAFMISLAIQITAIYGSKLLFRRWPREKSCVASCGMIASNSAYIGIPVNERLYGSVGVLYTAIFQIPIRFTMWSAGLALFTSVNKKDAFRKVITHPCILACVAGLIMMLTHISLPGILGDTVVALSRCTSPVSMLIIGSIIAGVNWRHLFSKEVLLFCLYRLVAFPLLAWGVLRLCNADATLTGVTMLLTAMPSGNMAAILSRKYGADSEFGTAIILTSILFSMITIPLLCFLLA